MNGYVARERFTTDPHTLGLLKAAASADPRYEIKHITGDTHEWIHYPDEVGRGTKPGNERTDFTRWVGGVLTSKAWRPRVHRVTLESDTPIRQVS